MSDWKGGHGMSVATEVLMLDLRPDWCGELGMEGSGGWTWWEEGTGGGPVSLEWGRERRQAWPNLEIALAGSRGCHCETARCHWEIWRKTELRYDSCFKSLKGGVCHSSSPMTSTFIYFVKILRYFGCKVQLVGISVPDQGSNLGHSSDNTES